MIHVTLPKIQPHPATKSEALEILADQRARAKEAHARLPEWRRYFEGLLEFVPEEHQREARYEIVPLLNALGRAAILDARKLAAECFTAMDQASGQ